MSVKEMKKLVEETKLKGIEVFKIPYGDKVAYLTKPERKHVELAMTNVRTKPLAIGEVLIANCWLCGDEELKKDTGFLVSLNNSMDDLIGSRKLEIKNC